MIGWLPCIIIGALAFAVLWRLAGALDFIERKDQ